MAKQANKGANILQSPDARKKFRASLMDVAAQYQLIDDRREVIKESIAELSDEYGIDKKHIRKLATTIHRANFGEQQRSNQVFETFYELVVGGTPAEPEIEMGEPDPMELSDVEDEE